MLGDNKKRIALLSNVTVDLLKGKLKNDCDLYVPDGYDTWIQEAVNPVSGIYSNKFDAIIILLDGTVARTWNTDIAREQIQFWKQGINTIVDIVHSIPIFISTVDFRMNRIKSMSERSYHLEFNNDWYQFAQDLSEHNDNVYVWDILDSITDIGRYKFYSDKMWYMSGMPYSRDGLNIVTRDIQRIIHSAFRTKKKIIVLDLDNTLWGGVVGEDGIEGIELSDHKEGQRYYDFQRQLLEMKNRGILLAINSKNNATDAKKAINEHPSMLIRSKDIVEEKINWENKATNLKAIEKDLNLTESSFVFIDDNPIEREVVTGECPDVTVPFFPEDTTTLLMFGEEIWLDYCRPLRVLSEDLKKTIMYQTEAKRSELKNTSLTLDDYIKKLEICLDIHRMTPDETERVVQLCNKTNQFNVTTKRYTKSEIESLRDESDKTGKKTNYIYTVHAKDKYGDNGLISVVIVKNVYAPHPIIDTFLMSCRVMGRKIENVIINCILNKLTDNNCESLIAMYIPTEKNNPVENLFDLLGFSLLFEDRGIKKYELLLENRNDLKFNAFKEIVFKDE